MTEFDKGVYSFAELWW